MDAGGAETVFMKYYRALDRSRYQLDFCVSSDEPGFYDDEIRELGGRIIHTVKKTEGGVLASFKRLKSIAKEGDYCSAIRSSQHSLSALDLLAMRIGGVPRTIFRSSNTGTVYNSPKEDLLHSIFRPLIKIAATSYIAPSTEAGVYMFGRRGVASRKFKILNNAVDVGAFAFSEGARSELRREFGIPENAFVVGHVGRFNQQKNHEFLVEVFREYLKLNENAVLLMLGKGELESKIRKLVSNYDLSSKVVFAGVRRDVPRCYSAMDVLVFPSLYEGLPNVVVEAQANGLPCIISDSITREVSLNENICFMTLEQGYGDWAHAISQYRSQRLEKDSIRLEEKGYDISAELPRFISVVFGE